MSGRNIYCSILSALVSPYKTKKPSARLGFFELGVWRCATLAWGNPTLPSPLIRFTSEFEMESGGTVSLLSPDIKSAKRPQLDWGSPTKYFVLKQSTVISLTYSKNLIIVIPEYVCHTYEGRYLFHTSLCVMQVPAFAGMTLLRFTHAVLSTQYSIYNEECYSI